MNNRLIFIIFLMAISTLMMAQGAEISYSRGDVAIRDSYGDIWDADPGFALTSGDTISTGGNSECEVLDGNTQILISSDTVFQYLEYSTDNTSVSGFQCVLGQMDLVLQNIAGGEPGPRIATASTVAGVRGTKLSVIAAADGSALIVVQEGRVEVEAAGKMVPVNAEQGVEVLAGEAPGEVFEVLRGQMDFSGWLKDQDQAFYDDPVKAVEGVITQMNEFAREISQINEQYIASKLEVDTLQEELKTLEGEERKN